MMKEKPRNGIFASVLFASLFLIACPHQGSTDANSSSADEKGCPDFAAAKKGTSTKGCTTAQRICLIASDLPKAIKQPDFLPDKEYASRYSKHVAVWNAELAEVAKTAGLESNVTAMKSRIDLLDGSETARRLIVENGDLLRDFSALADKAQRVLPAPGLGCTVK